MNKKYDTRPKFQRLKALLKRREQDNLLNRDYTLNETAIRRMQFNGQRG